MDFQAKQWLVAKHLLKKPITSWEAIVKYKATRLSAYIYNLRKIVNIKVELIKENGAVFAKYYLDKDEKEKLRNYMKSQKE